MYKPPAGPIYFDFRSFLKSQKKFITQYYDHIEFTPVLPTRGFKGDLMEQTVRDRYGEEIDKGYNYKTMRLYDALQSKAFRDKKLYIATDGGATKGRGTGEGKGSLETERGKGSLGFLITDDERNPFIRCYRQPAGMNPQSF